MGKFENTDKNEPIKESKEKKEEKLSGFELLQADHQETLDAEAELASKESIKSPELFRTSVFGRADSSIHEEAAKVGQLFTPENKAAIVANMPD